MPESCKLNTWNVSGLQHDTHRNSQPDCVALVVTPCREVILLLLPPWSPLPSFLVAAGWRGAAGFPLLTMLGQRRHPGASGDPQLS